MKILLLERDVSLRQTVERCIRYHCDHHQVLSTDEVENIDTLLQKEDDIEALLIDYASLDFLVLREITKKYCDDLKIIVMATISDRQWFLDRFKIHGYIKKPFGVEELCEVLDFCAQE